MKKNETKTTQTTTTQKEDTMKKEVQTTTTQTTQTTTTQTTTQKEDTMKNSIDTTTQNETKPLFTFQNEINRTCEKSIALLEKEKKSFFEYTDRKPLDPVYVFPPEKEGKGLNWRLASRDFGDLMVKFAFGYLKRSAVRMFYEKRISALNSEVAELREDYELSSSEAEKEELMKSIVSKETEAESLKLEEGFLIKAFQFEYPEELEEVYKCMKKEGAFGPEAEKAFLRFTVKYGNVDIRKTKLYSRITSGLQNFRGAKSDNTVMRERFEDGLGTIMNKKSVLSHIMVSLYDSMLQAGCVNSPRLTATMKEYFKEARKASK